MENRICPQCNTEYPPSRSDQKYCGPTCRWNAWRKRKEEKQTSKSPEKEEEKEPDLFANLRGIDKPEEKAATQQTVPVPEPALNPEPIKIPEPVQQETKEYREAMAEKTRVNAFGTRVLADLKTCDQEISAEKMAIEKLSNSKSYKKNPFRAYNIDMDDLFAQEEEDKEWNKKFRLEQSQKKLSILQKKREDLTKELDKANKEMNAVMNRLKVIPQFEKPKQPENATSISGIIKGLEQHKTNQEQPQIQPPVQILSVKQPDIVPVKKEIELPAANGKFISSSQLRGKKFDTFPFSGKWEEFLGRPSFTFHLAVHGKPGQGKSTFCMQFADYLASNFGKVVYISAEEGINATLQAKVDYNKIDNPHLIFADIKSYDEIKMEIKPIYNFIFIDSLDNLSIDAQKLKQLKARYPQSAFITISQSTKAGTMRGSLQIIHDSDITVKVANKFAVTEKNRFKENGKEFSVFQ